jgi:hypothetical protein
MYPSQPSERLRSALSLLPPLPCSVEVLSPEGGSFALTLAAVEGNLVYAYGARKLVRDDLVLEARLRDDRGEGWDIHFSILRSYFQSGDDLLLHLNVVAVDPRSATRLAARAHLAELSTARVLYAHSYQRDELFDVRLADASPTGAAFVSERRLATGDLLELETYIEDQVVRFEVRVVHTGPAVYGRNRSAARSPPSSRPTGTCCCAWPSATSATTPPSSATSTGRPAHRRPQPAVDQPPPRSPQRL